MGIIDAFKKDKHIFSGYFKEPFTKVLNKNQILCRELESLYVSKVGVVVLAYLLEMEVKNHGQCTEIVFDDGEKIDLSYHINQDNLTTDLIYNEKVCLENAYSVIAKKLSSIAGDNKNKNIDYPSQCFNYVFLKLVEEIKTGGDFFMDKLVALVNNSEANLLKLRKDNYMEERDIIYSAAARTLSGVLYKNAFSSTPINLRDSKLYELIKAQLKEEFYLVGRTREHMVSYLGGPEPQSQKSGVWEYVRQMQRIKNCPEMW